MEKRQPRGTKEVRVFMLRGLEKFTGPLILLGALCCAKNVSNRTSSLSRANRLLSKTRKVVWSEITLF